MDYNLELVPMEPVPERKPFKPTIVPKTKPVEDEKPELEIDDNWEDDTEYPEEVEDVSLAKNAGLAVQLTKVGDGYVNFNGKVYQIAALKAVHSDLNLNFTSEVPHGEGFPGLATAGSLFLRSDQEPTKLYRFNGSHWDQIDKNLLEASAYTDSYIAALIGRIGANDYNPELLNEVERNHIEKTLTEE
jgi:hypothetical protein